MLPAEAFAGVASFLGYYDLDGLKLTNKLVSAIANECAAAIPLFDFSEFTFYVYDCWISVYQLDAYGDDGPWVCLLEMPSEESCVRFISAAFRNCTVGRFELRTRRQQASIGANVLGAVRSVAKTIRIGILDVTVGLFENAQELLGLVGSEAHAFGDERDKPKKK